MANIPSHNLNFQDLEDFPMYKEFNVCGKITFLSDTFQVKSLE